MTSTAHVNGSLPTLGNPTLGAVFTGGWAVEYDWQADRVVPAGQPHRLSSLPYPPPFDQGVDGVLRGQGPFSEFLYLFKGGNYLKIREADMTPVQGLLPTAPAWGLPATWTNFDAVFPGGGVKSGFAYFFHGDEYVRFDWSTNQPSPGYPKKIGPNWHTSPPFTSDIDGVIRGQGAFDAKAYLFATKTVTVDDSGALGTGHTVQIPVYARYDFDKEIVDLVVDDPTQVIANWPGLLPLLDSGAAVDLGLAWCAAALTALNAKVASLISGAPADPAIDVALGHHFMTPTPDLVRVNRIITRYTEIRDRLVSIPAAYNWASLTPGPAHTPPTPTLRTEVSNDYSAFHGPNGRAAVQIHEAAHFVQGGPAFDVPEWSGATINGHLFPPPTGLPAYNTISPDNAEKNPASYASFAQEIAFGSDTRFGDARRQE